MDVRGARRGIAIALGVLVALEIGLRVTVGSGAVPAFADDPDTRPFHFAMPRVVERIFTLDAAAGVFSTGPLLLGEEPLAQDQTFPAQRAKGALRVAFVGGSTLQGPTLRPADTYPSLAADVIALRFPGRTIDVLNLGSGPANTWQLGRISDQLGLLTPDVVVIHTGANDAGYLAYHEVLLDAARARRRPLRRALEISALYGNLRRLRESSFGKTADRALFGPERDESQLGVEVPRTAPSLSESAFQIEPGWQDEYGPERFAALVQEHSRLLPAQFERNLREIARNLRDMGSEVVLVVPAANLRDFPPAVSFHARPDRITRRASKRFAALLQLARERLRRNGVAFVDTPMPRGTPKAIEVCETVLALLDEATEASDSWADVHFVRGTCLLHTDVKAAAAAFARARDLSPAHAPHHRPSTEIAEAVRRVAKADDMPLVDLPAALALASQHGVPGDDLFLDAIHLNAAGHRVASSALADALAGLRVVREGPLGRPPDPSPSEFLALREAASKAATRPARELLDARPMPTPDPDDLRAGNLGEGDYGAPTDPVPLKYVDEPEEPTPWEPTPTPPDAPLEPLPPPDEGPLPTPEPPPVSPDALRLDDEDRSGNVGDYDAPPPMPVAPPESAEPAPAPPEPPPVSPDALREADEDRSANLGEDDNGTPAPPDPTPEPDEEEERDTDRSGNVGEGDFGDPSGNQGEGDTGPVPR